jgi:hypothetical protein
MAPRRGLRDSPRSRSATTGSSARRSTRVLPGLGPATPGGGRRLGAFRGQRHGALRRFPFRPGRRPAWNGSRPGTQTDLFAGYQASFFGWPDLYTPFDSDETENLQTVLIAATPGRTSAAAISYRGGALLPPQQGRLRLRPLRAPRRPPSLPAHDLGIRRCGRREDPVMGDLPELPRRGDERLAQSTSLIYGPYHSRTLEKVSLVPEESVGRPRRRRHPEGWRLVRRLQPRRRGPFARSPSSRASWNSSGLRRIYASYSTTTEMPSYTALDSSPTSGLFPRQPEPRAHDEPRHRGGGFREPLGMDRPGGRVLQARRQPGRLDLHDGVFGRSANPVNIDTEGLELVGRRSWGSSPSCSATRRSQGRQLPRGPGDGQLLCAQLREAAAHGRGSRSS